MLYEWKILHENFYDHLLTAIRDMNNRKDSISHILACDTEIAAFTDSA